MKSVDLQTTVGRSTEVGRDIRVQSEQNEQHAQELAAEVSRQAQHASRSVRRAGKVDKNRVESRKNKEDKEGSRRRKQKTKERGRGRLLDVTCDS